MSAPRILDLFCGAGGAAVGYYRAGFEVVGVDIAPQPRYPFTFIQMDALEMLGDGKRMVWWDTCDAVHASPPCQDHSPLRHRVGEHGTGWLLAETIWRLEQTDLPFVVENVPGSGPELGGQWTMLCGSSFGLKVRRHRLFRSNIALLGLPCDHASQGTPVGCYGTGGGGQMTRGYKGTFAECCDAMGIGWMNRAELSQAIPPAFTQFIGEQLLRAVEQVA